MTAHGASGAVTWRVDEVERDSMPGTGRQRGDRAEGDRAETAWVAILIVAGATIAILLALANEYGFHRDELYFIVAGQHPALGYPDQPPFTPLVSAAAVQLLGLSPLSIRILPALCAGAIIVLAGLIARDLGGSKRAQLLAALLTAVSGLAAAGHLDSTTTYDLLAWAVIAWLVVRLLAGGDSRQWLLVGLAAGIALENKHIVLFLGAGLAIGILLARRWDVVRSPWPWLAVAIALLLWAPNLVWQAQHGFPQLEMASHISGNADENRGNLAPELILLLGTFTFPILIAGVWRLLRSPAAASWRPLGWAPVTILVVVVLIGGKSYYAVGFLPLLAAAGSISLDGWLARARLPVRAGLATAAIGATAVVSGLLALPIIPVTSLGATPIPDINAEMGSQVGWPQLVDTVTGVVDELTPDQRDRAVILAGNYGQAAAIELLGDGLPPVVSGHNGYWDWGPPPDDRTVVIGVGSWDSPYWRSRIGPCESRAVIDNGFDVPNEEQGRPVQVCAEMAQPWSVIWPDVRHLN